MSLKFKLLLALLAPIIICSVFYIKEAKTSKHIINSSQEIITLSKMATKIGNLVHELQKERGMSAGYLGSKGTKFVEDLPEQRKNVNAQFDKLNKFLKLNLQDISSEKIKDLLQSNNELITNLQNNFRKKIDQLEITVKEEVAYLTQINTNYLNAIAVMAKVSQTDVKTCNDIIAFVSFLRSKELAGIERAVSTSTIAAGKFNVDSFIKYKELITLQNTYLASFSEMASSEMQKIYENKYTGEAVENVLKLRKEALAVNLSEKKFTTSPEDCYAILTTKINLLKSLEGDLGNQLISLAQLELDTAKSEMTTLQTSALLVVAIFLIVLKIGHKISYSLKNISNHSSVMANGDFSCKDDSVYSKDEIGDLANSINSSMENLSRMINSVKGNVVNVKGISGSLKSVIESLNQQSGNLDARSQSVASTADQLNNNITSMATALEQLSVNTHSVSSSAEQMSVNMSSVSSAVEEMSTSIDTVANNAKDARKTAEEAQDISNDASAKMQLLNDASEDIGKVTEVIKRIAEQTNLLALNATIEAASAGEAGKGFAVVANEIKELAGQSAKAAEDIATKIHGVQHNTNDTVSAIEKVNDIIHNISHAVLEISNSVEEQSKTANDISSNISEASQGINEISYSISEIASGANEISNNATEISQGTNEVSYNIGEVNNISSFNKKEVEKIESETSSLLNATDELEELMNKFKVAS